MIAIAYNRAQHAAHYPEHPAIGHDLERWDVVGICRPVRPEGVPYDAEYHHGYLDEQKRQHYVFVRVAPLTGPRCSRCPAVRTCGAIGVQP